jgi:hypothetical protein
VTVSATIPVGDTAAGPIGPGHAFEFSVSAKPGQHLPMAMMFVQSNDLFYAPDSNAIALFDDKGRHSPATSHRNSNCGMPAPK